MWPWSNTLSPVVLDGHTPLRPKNISLRPTRLGYYLLVALLVLWVLAVNYQVNVAYVLIFLLLSVMVCGSLVTLQQLNGLILSVLANQDYFAGEAVALTIKASAGSRRKRWLWLCTANERAEQLSADWQPWVVSEQQATFVWTLPPQQRGYLPILWLRCFSIAPFGLIRVEALWQYKDNIVVYPQPIEHEFTATAVISEEGMLVSQASTHGEDLAFLLPHQHGSAMSHIAWKQYAKNQQLLDKYFDQHYAMIDSITISYRDYPQVHNKEQLAGLLCYRVLTAAQQGKHYQLELPQHCFTSSPAQLAQCLNALGVW